MALVGVDLRVDPGVAGDSSVDPGTAFNTPTP
jgi:hypothetical protein